jgi:hypothetical protein
MLVVPAELVGSLRAGLHAALTFAAEEIATRGMDVRRERDPEFYSDALGCFDRARALLSAIGWIEVDRPVEARFDLHEHWRATVAALEHEISASGDRVQEAAVVDAERAERGRALYEFTAMVQAQADRLG